MFKENVNQDYLERKLSFYGYPASQVRELLSNQRNISLESAVYQLSKDDQGRWNHSFKEANGIC